MRPLLLLLVALFVMAAAAPDAAIEKSLRARLGRSKLRQDGLSFAVKNGVVEWQGEVGVPQRKGAATRMAKAAGAAKVVNRIRIKPGVSAAKGAAPPRVVVVTKAPRS